MMYSSSILSHKFSSRAFLIVLALLITPFLLSCSSNPVDIDPDPSGPVIVTLTVAPANAMPGAVLTISGATVDTANLSAYRILVGGQQSLVITDSAGGISTVAPALFADTSATWPTASAGAVDIELFRDSTLVGIGKAIFTVDSLVPAPGSTQKIVGNTIAIVESYKSILAALSSGPSVQEQLAFGLTTMLDSLLYGRGDSSMTALLADMQANDPEALAFVDAIYGSSGSAAQSQAIADAMAAIVVTLDSINSGNLRRSAVAIDDVRLAATMQLASMYKLFGDTFIHGAASSASNIAFVSGWMNLANVIPGFAIVNAFAGSVAVALSLLDLIFNKITVATMPTVIDSLTITFSSDTLALGDTTVSSLRLYARNSPPQISLPDLLSQFAGLMGLSGPVATLEDLMLGTLNTLLGHLNSALQTYHSSHPGFSYDPTLFDIGSIPIIYWETEVNDPRLIDLHTFSPKLAIEESLLEWRSTGNTGFANVTITPGIGEDAVLIPIPPFLGYGGTAFGLLGDSSAFVSESKEIAIHTKLVLLVDFAPTISREGANVLGVRAGEIGIAGDTLWRSGLDVSLLVTGGGVSPTGGVTDSEGRFSSIITLFSTFDTVEVVVKVTRVFGGFAAETVSATVNEVYNLSGSFSGAVVSGDSTLLTVIAIKTTVGGTVAAAGLQLSLLATNATVTSVDGITDASGMFSVWVKPDNNVDSLNVDVTASINGGQVAFHSFKSSVGLQNIWPASWAGTWTGGGREHCRGKSGVTTKTIIAGKLIIPQRTDSLIVGIVSDNEIEVRMRAFFGSTSAILEQGVVISRNGNTMVGEEYSITTSIAGDTLVCGFRSTFTLTRDTTGAGL